IGRDTYRIMARASDRRVLIGAASLARNRLGLTIKFLSLFLATRTGAMRSGDGNLVASEGKKRVAGTHVRGNPTPTKSYRPVAEKARRDGFRLCCMGTRSSSPRRAAVSLLPKILLRRLGHPRAAE